MTNGFPTAQKIVSSTRIIRIVILLSTIVLISSSSVWMFLFVRTTRLTAFANATATVVAATATRDIATSTAQTAVAGTEIASSRATATVAAEPDPYANGRLILYDNLATDQSSTQSWRWEQNDTCAFQNNAYHVTYDSPGWISDCPLSTDNNSSLSFNDFTLEVKMTILRGDEGGIVFRQSSSTLNPLRATDYTLLFDADGHYQFNLYPNASSTPVELARGSSSAFRTGYGQMNTIGLVARGSTFTWYVNAQRVGNANDKTYRQGSICLASATYANHTGSPEVAYTDFKIWRL